MAFARKRPNTRMHSHRRVPAGLYFSGPWIVGLLVIMLGPMLASLYYSFTDFHLFGHAHWRGLHNYARLIHDARFAKTIWNTLYLAIIGVPLGLILALAVALALNFPVRGQPIYRALVYLPSIVPIVTAVYLWRWIFNTQYGLLTHVLGALGLPQPNWLGNPLWTKPAVLLVILWTVGATAIIYLAALQQVPQNLYESAAVDGANMWQRFWHVTWPRLTPVTLFQLIVGVIESLQIFTEPYLLAQQRLNETSGGPSDSLLTLSVSLYQNAFVFLKMGYASAMAWVLFVIIGILTVLILLSSRRWVHYDTE